LQFYLLNPWLVMVVCYIAGAAVAVLARAPAAGTVGFVAGLIGFFIARNERRRRRDRMR
jgi:phosphotransferase system  glucose/maltose/N-acetylglucosamine-specific IIC component